MNELLAIAGLRDKIKWGASGKIVSTVDIGRAISHSADWCNSARGFMFALDCIQAQICHANRCPVGVTTQDRWSQRGLLVRDKAERVHRFHRDTLRVLSEVLMAAGLAARSALRPAHFSARASQGETEFGDEVSLGWGPVSWFRGRVIPAMPGIENSRDPTILSRLIHYPSVA